MELDKVKSLNENDIFIIGGRSYHYKNGVLRKPKLSISSAQAQTKDTFGFKWKKEDTFNSDINLTRMKNWLFERYTSPEYWLSQCSTPSLPIILDAGCGAGMSGFEYWRTVSDKIRYVGVDISEAVDVAKKRAINMDFAEEVFIQDNIADLPFLTSTFDVIFSEGVLHHTDDTRKTFDHLCQFLKPGGLFMFYVYRKKSPIREFTDDFIREKLQDLPAEKGWEQLKSLTQLGIELGNLNIDISVPDNIDLLGIPAGKISLQRLFYWHIFKAFYDPNLTFDEMHHINFDWYAPKNAHRHTIEEIQEWCLRNQLDIELLKDEMAGITCVAKKKLLCVA